MSEFELGEVASSAAAAVEGRLRAPAPRVLWSVDPAAPLRVEGNRDATAQVLELLALAAAPFTPGGVVSVVALSGTTGEGRPAVRFEVRSTNPEAAAEACMWVLDHDYIRERTNVPPLTEAKAILDSLGLDFGLAGTADGGSAFWFGIPLSAQTPALV